ncbi:MAG TPA: histidine phosphatase family protein [Candidatus Saccharimonadales bacterium]|nr:histidine phosphatase family protein [Candidatus Saccharimonadales bacterium]
MKVYIARHGETNYNIPGLCNDSPKIDVHLTDKGIEQAQELADSLSDANFDLVIISEFPRIKETADILNQHHHAPMIVDARINDVLTGFEGKPAKDFREARLNAENRWTVRFNGGESFEDEKARVQSFLDDLKKRDEKTVLVVTHQAIARLIYAIDRGLPNEKVDDLGVSNTHCFDIEL